MANIFTRVSRKRTAEDSVTVNDGSAESGRLAIGGGPIGDLVVDADSGAVIVTHYGAAAVSVLDPGSSAVAGVTVVPGEPFAVVAANDRAYVTTASSTNDAVSVIDTVSQSVIAEYPLAFCVTTLAVSPDGKKVFAGRGGHGHVDVAVIDITAERAGTIDVAAGPGINIDALRVDAAGKRLYVATSDDNGSRLMVIDIETTRVAASVRIGAPIRDLALCADGTAYVLTSDRLRGGVIEIVDLSTLEVTGTIEIGRAPVQLALSPDGTTAYVVDFDHVAVLCTLTNEVLDTIKVGARPSCIALDVDGSRLYVGDYAGTVSAFPVGSTRPQRYSQYLATDRIPMWVPEPEQAAV